MWPVYGTPSGLEYHSLVLAFTQAGTTILFPSPMNPRKKNTVLLYAALRRRLVREYRNEL